MSNYHPPIPNVNPTDFRRKLIKVGVIVVALSLVLAAVGILQRSNANAELAQLASQSAIPTVSVMTATLSDDAGTLVLPGNLEPLNSASIYAQTNGYIKEWLVDIGDSVKKGQVLAILDAPELLHQLAQGKADYATALAEQNNAQSMADRANSLMKMNSAAISREVVDSAAAKPKQKPPLLPPHAQT